MYAGLRARTKAGILQRLTTPPDVALRRSAGGAIELVGEAAGGTPEARPQRARRRTNVGSFARRTPVHSRAERAVRS
jgi:hypothetical protein